ncbi:MAG: hypothetical protein WBY53_19085 [Acidobacteriaceae bacterium]
MRKLLLSLLFLGPMVCASGQAPSGALDVGDTWHHLAALPPHSHLHVSADGGGRTCYLIAVDEQSLRCGRKDGGLKGQHVFPRAAVKKVKLTRYGASAVAGAGIGAGIGAVVGFAGTQNPNGWFNGDIRGVVTGLGAGVGALAMGPTDVFRGPTVYRRRAKSE